MVEEPAEVDPKDVGWWDLLLTNRSRGFLKRRKFIKLVMTFTDCKWKQAAKLVDKLPSHVLGASEDPKLKDLSELEKLGGKCALERGADEPPGHDSTATSSSSRTRRSSDGPRVAIGECRGRRVEIGNCKGYGPFNTLTLQRSFSVRC